VSFCVPVPVIDVIGIPPSLRGGLHVLASDLWLLPPSTHLGSSVGLPGTLPGNTARTPLSIRATQYPHSSHMPVIEVPVVKKRTHWGMRWELLGRDTGSVAIPSRVTSGYQS